VARPTQTAATDPSQGGDEMGLPSGQTGGCSSRYPQSHISTFRQEPTRGVVVSTRIRGYMQDGDWQQ